jgi:NTE family protein
MIHPKWYVFAGGGMHGIAFVGALTVLEQHYRKTGGWRLHGYVGVSVGSLTALLLTLGYTLDELRDVVFNMDYSALQNINEDTLVDALENCGIDDGVGLRAFVEKLLATRGLGAGASFADLVSADKAAPALRIYACRLRDGVCVEFSRRRTPHTPIVDALCASMAVPFYYTPVMIGGELYVDAGVVNNYPIDLLSPAEQQSALGFLFRLDDRPFVLGDDYSILAYGHKLIKIMTMDRYRAQLRHFGDRTILINSGSIQFLDFGMTADVKERLIELGAGAARAFLSRKRPPPQRRYSVS